MALLRQDIKMHFNFQQLIFCGEQVYAMDIGRYAVTIGPPTVSSLVLLLTIISPVLSSLLLPSPVFQPNLSSIGANRDPECTSSPSWLAPDWDSEDCLVAIDMFYTQIVLSRPDVYCEYLAINAQPSWQSFPQCQTPLRYTESG